MGSELIVMLTYDDLTVRDAYQIFEQSACAKAKYWGFKEAPLPLKEMQRIYGKMKEYGKETILEVVSYSEEEGLAGAQMAHLCGCDIMMGTCFHDSINDYCQNHGIKYMPFVGEVCERPSILKGAIEAMVEEAQGYIAKGAYGIDLLGFRYVGDAPKLIQEMVRKVDAPICVAGSINSEHRLEIMKQTNPWAFTIGSAFFDKKFGNSFVEQIDYVCDYMTK